MSKDKTSLWEKTEASFKLFEGLSDKRLRGVIEDGQKYLVPVLRVIGGPLMGEHYTLSRELNVIGRDSSCQITLKDPKLSRKHCQISILTKGDQIKDFTIEVEDLESRNGLLVNDKKVKGKVILRAGDQIRLGTNLFGLYLKYPEEIELETYLFKLATRDPTTGLLTKSFFESNLEFEFKRAARYRRPLSFVLMDIDHFKNVNDSYGHQIGDEVLKKVGELIHAEVRFEDTAIRYGGEEMAIILPETKGDDAFKLTERIRKRLEGLNFKLGNQAFKVTASFGIAELSSKILLPSLLVETADKALYEAKRSGRNRCVMAQKLAS